MGQIQSLERLRQRPRRQVVIEFDDDPILTLEDRDGGLDFGVVVFVGVFGSLTLRPTLHIVLRIPVPGLILATAAESATAPRAVAELLQNRLLLFRRETLEDLDLVRRRHACCLGVDPLSKGDESRRHRKQQSGHRRGTSHHSHQNPLSPGSLGRARPRALAAARVARSVRSGDCTEARGL